MPLPFHEITLSPSDRKRKGEEGLRIRRPSNKGFELLLNIGQLASQLDLLGWNQLISPCDSSEMNAVAKTLPSTMIEPVVFLTKKVDAVA